MSLDITLSMPLDIGGQIVKVELYEANITHNLTGMAMEAGVYQLVWKPYELGFTIAEDLIDGLKSGIELLKSDPPRFRAFNPPNGWGSYESFLYSLEKYLDACILNKRASICAHP